MCPEGFANFKHDTRSVWASVMKSRLCDEIEALKRTLNTHPFVKFVNESTLAI